MGTQIIVGSVGETPVEQQGKGGTPPDVTHAIALREDSSGAFVPETPQSSPHEDTEVECTAPLSENESGQMEGQGERPLLRDSSERRDPLQADTQEPTTLGQESEQQPQSAAPTPESDANPLTEATAPTPPPVPVTTPTQEPTQSEETAPGEIRIGIIDIKERIDFFARERAEEKLHARLTSGNFFTRTFCHMLEDYFKQRYISQAKNEIYTELNTAAGLVAAPATPQTPAATPENTPAADGNFLQRLRSGLVKFGKRITSPMHRSRSTTAATGADFMELPESSRAALIARFHLDALSRHEASNVLNNSEAEVKLKDLLQQYAIGNISGRANFETAKQEILAGIQETEPKLLSATQNCCDDLFQTAEKLRSAHAAGHTVNLEHTKLHITLGKAARGINEERRIDFVDKVVKFTERTGLSLVLNPASIGLIYSVASIPVNMVALQPIRVALASFAGLFGTAAVAGAVGAVRKKDKVKDDIRTMRARETLNSRKVEGRYIGRADLLGKRLGSENLNKLHHNQKRASELLGNLSEKFKAFSQQPDSEQAISEAIESIAEIEARRYYGAHVGHDYISYDDTTSVDINQLHLYRTVAEAKSRIFDSLTKQGRITSKEAFDKILFGAGDKFIDELNQGAKAVEEQTLLFKRKEVVQAFLFSAGTALAFGVGSMAVGMAASGISHLSHHNSVASGANNLGELVQNQHPSQETPNVAAHTGTPPQVRGTHAALTFHDIPAADDSADAPSVAANTAHSATSSAMTTNATVLDDGNGRSQVTKWLTSVLHPDNSASTAQSALPDSATLSSHIADSQHVQVHVLGWYDQDTILPDGNELQLKVWENDRGLVFDIQGMREHPSFHDGLFANIRELLGQDKVGTYIVTGDGQGHFLQPSADGLTYLDRNSDLYHRLLQEGGLSHCKYVAAAEIVSQENGVHVVKPFASALGNQLHIGDHAGISDAISTAHDGASADAVAGNGGAGHGGVAPEAGKLGSGGHGTVPGNSADVNPKGGWQNWWKGLHFPQFGNGGDAAQNGLADHGAGLGNPAAEVPADTTGHGGRGGNPFASFARFLLHGPTIALSQSERRGLLFEASGKDKRNEQESPAEEPGVTPQQTETGAGAEDNSQRSASEDDDTRETGMAAGEDLEADEHDDYALTQDVYGYEKQLKSILTTESVDFYTLTEEAKLEVAKRAILEAVAYGQQGTGGFIPRDISQNLESYAARLVAEMDSNQPAQAGQAGQEAQPAQQIIETEPTPPPVPTGAVLGNVLEKDAQGMAPEASMSGEAPPVTNQVETDALSVMNKWWQSHTGPAISRDRKELVAALGAAGLTFGFCSVTRSPETEGRYTLNEAVRHGEYLVIGKNDNEALILPVDAMFFFTTLKADKESGEQTIENIEKNRWLKELYGGLEKTEHGRFRFAGITKGAKLRWHEEAGADGYFEMSERGELTLDPVNSEQQAEERELLTRLRTRGRTESGGSNRTPEVVKEAIIQQGPPASPTTPESSRLEFGSDWER